MRAAGSSATSPATSTPHTLARCCRAAWLGSAGVKASGEMAKINGGRKRRPKWRKPMKKMAKKASGEENEKENQWRNINVERQCRKYRRK
jgi:hypothetical protein